jgi:ParB-like chromosome segregation protein Spo0J
MKVTKASLGIGDLHFSNSPARRHTKKQLRKTVNMFAEQGIVSPIVVDRSCRIIDGHLRVMAARELGIEALDALGYRPPAPEAKIPMDHRPIMH